MYFHENYGCYVISSVPSSDDFYEEEFDIYAPLLEEAPPIYQLHKNYVIETPSAFPCIGLARPFATPTHVSSVRDEPFLTNFTEEFLTPVVRHEELVAPTTSLLDEPLPLDFFATVLSPIIHKEVPTAKLIDIQDSHISSACSCMHLTSSMLDEPFPIDSTPTLIPRKDQDVPDIKQELQTPLSSTPTHLSEIASDTQQSDREHRFACRNIAFYIYACIIGHFAILMLQSSADSHISEVSPLCKVRVRSQCIQKSPKTTCRPICVNPCVKPTVLSWSLLPPDKDECHIQESQLPDTNYAGPWKEQHPHTLIDKERTNSSQGFEQ